MKGCGAITFRGETAILSRWEFGEVPAGTRVQLEVNYEYDVPLIGALIKNLLRKKMQQNTDAMLAALKEEAESASPE